MTDELIIPEAERVKLDKRWRIFVWATILVPVLLILVLGVFAVPLAISGVETRHQIHSTTGMLTVRRIEMLKQTAERVRLSNGIFFQGDENMPPEFNLFNPSWVSVTDDRVSIMFIGGSVGFGLDLDRESDGRWRHRAYIEEDEVLLPDE